MQKLKIAEPKDRLVNAVSSMSPILSIYHSIAAYGGRYATERDVYKAKRFAIVFSSCYKLAVISPNLSRNNKT